MKNARALTANPASDFTVLSSITCIGARTMTQAANLDFIQWMQLADALAWAISVVVFFPSIRALWERRDTVLDLMAPPILLIAINQIWASSAWLLFPQAMFVPNALFLWTAVHAFSILCAFVVTATYRRAASKVEP